MRAPARITGRSLLSAAPGADGCLIVLLMRPSGPLEAEGESSGEDKMKDGETGGGRHGERRAQSVFVSVAKMKNKKKSSSRRSV